MELVKKIEITSEAKMLAFGAKLAALFKDGGFIALNGALGSGKTVLTRGFAFALGISRVCSPTFTLVQEYDTLPLLFHFDVYRVKDENELFSIGYDDYLAESGAIILMEWASLFPSLLPAERLDIFIEGSGESPRKLTLTSHGDKYRDIIMSI